MIEMTIINSASVKPAFLRNEKVNFMAKQVGNWIRTNVQI
jgi:hypothetical protein